MTFFQEIKKHIYIHPARQESLLCMIQGLCLYQSVSLRQLAYAIRGTASLDSKIRRVQRFFQHQVFDYIAIGKAILSLLKLPEKVILTLDRTEWMFGKTPINFMVLGVLNGDISIPLAFSVLTKKGNSNTKERCWIINLLLKIIPSSRIHSLLADREFIGQKWFELLIQKGIPFAIRLKSSTKMLDPHTGKNITIGKYYQSIKQGEYMIETRIWDQKVHLTFKKKRCNLSKVVFLAISSTDLSISWLKKYRKRWSIERMFLSLKTHGFNLEQTHLTHPHRLSKLMAVLAIAFAICCKMGKFLNEVKPIKIKKHGRKLYSIFTYGLICIKERLYKPLYYNEFLEGL